MGRPISFAFPAATVALLAVGIGLGMLVGRRLDRVIAARQEAREAVADE
jgi:hypothetical protein